MAGEFQIRQELRFVNRFQSLDGFEFDNHTIFNEDVHNQINAKFDTFVGNRNALLWHEPDPTKAQFMTQRSLVDRLKQPGP